MKIYRVWTYNLLALYRTIPKPMEYKIIKPYKDLNPFIHFYWELKGNEAEPQRERVFPDGCAGNEFFQR